MAHQLAEQSKLYHKTTGTRYRILTISVHPIEKKIETTRQIVSSQLRSAAAMTFPIDEHVSAVVNAPSRDAATRKIFGRPTNKK